MLLDIRAVKWQTQDLSSDIKFDLYVFLFLKSFIFIKAEELNQSDNTDARRTRTISLAEEIGSKC